MKLHLLIALTLLSGCGRALGIPEEPPPASKLSSGLIFSATSSATAGDVLQLLQVDPQNGRASPFGPPVHVSHSMVSKPWLYVAGDRSRVALLTPDNESHYWELLETDGRSWNLLGSGVVEFDGISVNGAIASFRTRDPDRCSYHVSVVDAKGKVLLDIPGTNSCSGSVVTAFSPDEKWFLYRKRVGDLEYLVRRTVEGEETVLQEGEWDTARVFSDSVIVMSQQRLLWLNLDGTARAVSGFDGSSVSKFLLAARGFETIPSFWPVHDLYQYSNGTLYLLDAAGLNPVLDLPTSPLDQAVLGAFANHYTILASLGSLTASVFPVGSTKPFTMTPLPSQAQPSSMFGMFPSRYTRSIAINSQSEILRDAGGLILLSLQHYATADNPTPGLVTGEPTEYTADLWSFDISGTQTVHRFAHQDVLSGPRTYRFSSDGAFIVWADGGQLHRVDTNSFTEDVFTIADYALIDAAP